MKPLVLKGKGFILRAYRASDIPSIVRNINDPVIGRNTSVPYPYRLSDARAWIRKTREATRPSKDKVHFAIDRDGDVIGGIGLQHIHPGHKAEIGYWLTKRFRGRGIIPRAIRLLIRYGFDRLKLKRIYAFTFTWNSASMRALEKSGFKREGTLRKHLKRRGRYYDHHLFARVR